MNNNDNNDNNNMDDNVNYEIFHYCGEHVDGCDRDGPIIVYHYISKERLNGRNLNLLNDWEYDLEFWPGDRHWRQASLKQDILINMDDVQYM